MNTAQSQVFVGKIETWIKPFIGLSIVSLIWNFLIVLYYYYARGEITNTGLNLLTFFRTWGGVFSVVNLFYWVVYLRIAYLFLKWLAGMGAFLGQYKKTGINPLEGLGVAFFIPIISWFMPYKGIASFFRYTIYAQAHINDKDLKNLRLGSLDKTETKYDQLLLFWWITWLLASNLWLFVFVLDDSILLGSLAFLRALLEAIKLIFWCISTLLFLKVLRAAQEEANILEQVVERGEDLDSDQDLYDTLIL